MDRMTHPLVAVITGATGDPLLKHAIASVQAQTYPNIVHYIVVDGQQFEGDVVKMVGKLPLDREGRSCRMVVLPENTGGTGYVCHRINGAMPWLVNAQYVSFLDQDNMFAPTHIESLVSSIPRGGRWAYSLRTVIDRDGREVCKDRCESLGGISHTVLDRDDRLIDTNCYLLDRVLAVQISPLWNVKARQPGVMEADRQVCRVLLDNEPVHGASRQHSVLYRVGGREDSVGAPFFLQGNTFLDVDTAKEDIYVFHFSPEITAAYFDPAAMPKDPLGEYCMTLWDSLRSTYNVFDGYANVGFLPRGAKCVVAMCQPSTLPLEVFKTRKDLVRILYTAEGPNIRHSEQWAAAFLKMHFDVVLTYWTPLLRNPDIKTIPCPHNARFLDFPRDDHLLSEYGNCAPPAARSVGMVLERRFLRGHYTIDQHTVCCLDSLRETYVVGLKDITVYGNGWASFVETHPDIKLGYSMPRHRDTNRSVDLLRNFTFALIIENCDAEGYVSEKIGDAFLAGAIPLYYGVPSDTHVRIPEDMYIDIKDFRDGTQLQQHLDTLTETDVQAYRTAIMAKRKGFFELRGSKAVAEAVMQAFHL